MTIIDKILNLLKKDVPVVKKKRSNFIDPSLSPLVLFITGLGMNHKGVMINDVWKWEDNQLETTHDYIQWLFPMDMPSEAVCDAPFLTGDDIVYIRSSMIAQKNIRTSLRMFLLFLGLYQTKDGVFKTASFENSSKNWLTSNNHNFLRITRVLTSLKLLGFDKDSAELFHFLKELNGQYSELTKNSMVFWERAML